MTLLIGWPKRPNYLHAYLSDVIDHPITISTSQHPNIPTTLYPTLVAPHYELTMGASASKSAKSAGSAVRKYPARAPPATTTRAAPVASAPGPIVHTPVPPAGTKTEGE